MFSSIDRPERMSGSTSQRVAFDRYELDLRSGELRKDGRRIRLQAQPFQLLAMLIENPGEVVMRDEVCRALWQTDTFVDFDHSVAAAVNKIREALGDSAENPRFVETVPKRGYRFIGKIKPEVPVVMAAAKPPQAAELLAVPAAKAWSGNKRTLRSAVVAVAVVLAVLFIWLARKPGNSHLDSHLNSPAMTIVPFTSYPGQETAPSFSPDGSRIAFSWDDGTGNRSGRLRYDLYVKAIGSETLLRVNNHPSDFAAPLNWSPDGEWIAYADTENGRPGDRAFLLNAETLESHEFPHDPACRHEGNLTFSHSGHELAILCVHNTTVAAAAANGDALYEIRVGDGEVHKLPGAAGEWPTISNARHKLAVSVTDNHLGIWRKDLQHPEVATVQMYSSTRSQSDGQYSPDGKHVAFDSERSGTWSVWMADSEGSNLVQISREALAVFPRSPDSQTIVFQMFDEPSGLWGVYTADISDRVPHKLKTNIRESQYPYWSHDGKWIYFLGYEGTGHQLYRCPAAGGEATLLVGSIESTAAIESFDGKLLYFPLRWGDANIMMLAPDRPGAAPQQVPQMPKIFEQSQWAVVPEGIYFSLQDNPRSIGFYDFATKHARELFRADKDLAEGMSISPDGRYMLFSQIDESNADIMLVDHFR